MMKGKGKMKSRGIAAAVATSVALAGGVVAAPGAVAEEKSSENAKVFEAFQQCMTQVDGEKEKLGHDFTEEEWAAFKGDTKGSSAPGDSFSYCVESGLSSDNVDRIAQSWIIVVGISVAVAAVLGMFGSYRLVSFESPFR